MTVFFVFALESPHGGDSNEYTQIYHFQYKKKEITLNYPKFAAMIFFLETQERVQNSRSERTIRVRAIGVLLYFWVWINFQGKNSAIFIFVSIYKRVNFEKKDFNPQR